MNNACFIVRDARLTDKIDPMIDPYAPELLRRSPPICEA
jgi:hypothetical protein